MRWILVVVLLLIVRPINAEDDDGMRIIELSASGVIKIQPQIARIHLSVETTGSSAQLASEANALKMEAVLKELRNLGLPMESIRTLSYHVSPQYDNSRRRDLNPIGYLAQNSLQVRLDSLSQVGRTIDAAISAGANRVTSLNYEVNNPQAAYQEALRAAVSLARQQAEVLASSAGEKLGPVQRIRSSSPIRFAESASKVMALRDRSTTPIQSGPIEIIASVTVEFQILDR